MIPSIARLDRLNAATGIVVGLALVDLAVQPGRAVHWSMALAAMIVIRLVVGVLSGSRRSEAQRRAARDAGASGGLMLAVALAVVLLRAVGPEHGWVADRAFGIVVGLVLLVIGNAIPKASVPPTDSARTHGSYATRRFAGWMFAGAGAIGLSAWLFAPVADAANIATVACFGAVALVVVRCVASPVAKAVD